MSDQSWYEIYGDRKCLVCDSLLNIDEKGRFCVQHASDILMGVGAMHYPTPEDFIKEAEEMGVSKRIGNFFPEDIKSGISRCFLIHNSTKEVFAFFPINGVEVIVKDNTDLSAELQRLGVKPIKVSIEVAEPDRGCGERDEGSAYVVCYTVSPDDLHQIMAECDHEGYVDVKGPLIVFQEPIPWKELNYTIRGFIYVDGKKIFHKEHPDKWKW